MSCTRGSAVSLTVSQLVAVLFVLVYCPTKRPLFLYSTSLSDVDALSAYNASAPSFTMWFRRDEFRAAASVNPYAATVARSEVARHATTLNSPFSSAYIIVVVSFALFSFPAFLGCVYTFSSVRLLDSGQMDGNTNYGEHEVKECLMWEVTFWTLVCTQHAVAQCVLCSPVDVLYVLGTSFAATVLLLVFCILAVNAEGDSASRRFEGPVFILIVLVYMLIVSQTKILLGRQFTFMMWLAHIAIHAMLVLGHLWDNPLSCGTVLNCRWTYVVASCWMNVMLYLAY